MPEITHASPACNRLKPQQPLKTAFSLLIRQIQIYGPSALDPDLAATLSPKALAAVADALERYGVRPAEAAWLLRPLYPRDFHIPIATRIDWWRQRERRL